MILQYVQAMSLKLRISVTCLNQIPLGPNFSADLTWIRIYKGRNNKTFELMGQKMIWYPLWTGFRIRQVTLYILYSNSLRL